MAEPLLLTVDEAATTLRCSRRRVFVLLAEGKLVRGPCFGRRTVVLAESVFAACEAAFDPPPEVKRKRHRRADKLDLKATAAARIREARSWV